MTKALSLAFCTLYLPHVAASAAASASEIPKYPVDRICRRFAEYAAGGAVDAREMIAKRCVLEQQDAYDRLKTDWARLTETEHHQCLRMTGDATNYRSLEACVGSMAARREEEQRVRDAGPFKY